MGGKWGRGGMMAMVTSGIHRGLRALGVGSSRNARKRAAWIGLAASAQATAQVGIIEDPSISSEFQNLVNQTCHLLQRSPSVQAWMTPEARNKAAFFDRVFLRNIWGGALSKSGPGSEPGCGKVKAFLESLQECFETLKVCGRPLRLLDFGCGDLVWILPWVQELAQTGEIEYIGVDISPEVVKVAQERLGPDGTVILADPSEAALDGIEPVDLVVSKDALNHMCPKLVLQCLNCLSKLSPSLLTNCCPGMMTTTGEEWGTAWSRYDYSLPPFSLKLQRIVREGAHCGKSNKRHKENVSLFCLTQTGPDPASVTQRHISLRTGTITAPYVAEAHGYLTLKVGDHVEIVSSKIEPGAPEDRFEWYLYGEIENGMRGWFPQDVINFGG